MEYLWIEASVAAALFQSVRYAALKLINQRLSLAVTTYVRILFALPFLVAYLLAVMWVQGAALPATPPAFVIYSSISAIFQFLGTLLVVRLFQLGNFAVATMLIKADVIMTALIGTALFSESISPVGWAAIFVTFAGVILVSAGRAPPAAGEAPVGWFELLLGKSVRIGLLSALIYAVSYLSLREGILALDPAIGPVMRSAYGGAMMTTVSVVLVGIYLLFTDPKGLKQIREVPGLALVIGIASALGTIAWFLASALTNASYVAAVAQVQIVFTMLISRFYFKEQIRPLELAGVGVILAGILMFRLA